MKTLVFYTLVLPLTVLIINSNVYSQTGDWEEVDMYTGKVPSCIYVYPQYNFSLDNFLRISVGSGGNVVVKLHDYFSDVCIRCIYVSAGDTYEIRNIPEGKYYVKIAFGKKWSVRITDNNSCESKFRKNAAYKEGEDILDYNIIYTGNGYQIPSYEIRLDMTTSKKKNAFDTKGISEEEFFR